MRDEGCSYSLAFRKQIWWGGKWYFREGPGGQALPKRGASVGPYEDSFALERK